ARIRLGQFGEVAGSHHHFGIWEPPSCFDIAGEGSGKSEMDRIEDRIDDKRKPAPQGVIRGADKRIEITVLCWHKNGRGTRAFSDIKRAFIKAQQKIRAGLGAARK